MLANEPGVLSGSDYYIVSSNDIDRKDIFPYLAFCGHYFCQKGYDINRPSYEPMLLAHINDGQMFLEYDDQHYELTADSMFIIDCQRPHRYYAGDYVNFVWAHMAGGDSLEICHDIIDKFGPVVRNAHSSVIKENLMSIISHFRNDQVPSGYQISADLYSCLCHFYPQSHVDVRMDKNELINVSIEFMKFNLAADINLDSIAGSVHLSKHYFSRLFRQHTGTSPYDYLIKLRMDLAKHLLTTTDLPVHEVAYQVGYKSDMGFSIAFTEKVGCPPGQYRSFIEHSKVIRK